MTNDHDHRVPFEATTDPMAVVDVSGDEWRVRAVNTAFVDAFGRTESAIHGEGLRGVIGTSVCLPARPDETRETYAQLPAFDAERLLRVSPLDRGADPERALVVVGRPPSERASRAADRNPAVQLSRALAEVSHADDVSAVRDTVAETLPDAFGFDAVTISLDDGARSAHVDEPIPAFELDAEKRLWIGHGVHDERNDETWGTVVHCTVGDHGNARLAARPERPLGPEDARRIEAFCGSLERILDALDRRRSLHAENRELAMFNRILRHSTLNGLNLIRARLDLVEPDVSEATREHYETAYARADDLLDRIEAIREMRSDDDAVDADARPLDGLVEKRLARASEKYPEASFSVDGSIPDAAVRVDELAHVCLRNVLRNAVQHADIDTPEVRVHADADRAAGVAVVGIADNGAGLPDDLDESVFDAGVSSYDGEDHGLGLFLTKKIVEDEYGGTVRAIESDRGGTEIVLELPLGEAERAADRPDTPD